MSNSLERASARGISPITLTVKVITEGLRWFLRFCLCETGFGQAPIPLEELTAAAAHRLGADGSKFMATVGLVEGMAGYPQPIQSILYLK